MQELFRDEPWKLLVCCVLLNRCSRKVAEPIWNELFRRKPTPESIMEAPAFDMVSLLRPLGFQNVRTDRILKMTADYLQVQSEILEPGFDVSKLRGVGKYGADSFNMFVRGEMMWDVEDKELKRYVEWVKSLGSESSAPAVETPSQTDASSTTSSAPTSPSQAS